MVGQTTPLRPQEEYFQTVDEMKNKLNELLSFQKHTVRDIAAKPLKHNVPGVYLVRTPDGEIVYAGRTKTKDIAGRIRDHRSIDTQSDLRGMLIRFKSYPSNPDQYLVQYMEVKEDRQRMLLEHFLIAILDPPFNK